MKQLSKYKLNKVVDNLEYIFNNAKDTDIESGKLWYKEANNIVSSIALNNNIEPIKVASVISALSPRNKWERNIYDTKQVIKAYNKGLTYNDVKVCTFNNNKIKAFKILANELQITDKSLKTYNFVNNIAYLSKYHLTIDIWHLRAAFNKMYKIDSATIGRLAYKQIKDITIDIANKHNLTGYQYQAIIWEAIRNNNNLIK